MTALEKQIYDLLSARWPGGTLGVRELKQITGAVASDIIGALRRMDEVNLVCQPEPGRWALAPRKAA